MQEQADMPSDWDLDRVPLAEADRAAIRANEDLFYLVTAASFVESGADLYTGNLAHYFDGDAEVVGWLEAHWMPEEIRHGRVLRDYVKHVWPEFDWDRAYAAFLADYSQRCTEEELEPTRGLELAARCVVETATSTFYQALSAQTTEPILAGIANRIRADEIGHYKHFYRYFRKYGASREPGRLRVARTLGRRVLEARRGDGDCALWHAYVGRQAPGSADKAAFQALSRRLLQRLRPSYPVDIAVKMLFKPLDLPPGVARLLQGTVARSVRWVLR